MVDCSDSKLKRVPDFPDHVIVIDLKNNDNLVLSDESFENCTNVRKLDLSNNAGISVIRNIMLRGMPNLEEISLNNMRGIFWNEQSFPDNTFENLTRLMSVSVQRLNDYQYISMTEFSFMMQKLPKSLVDLNVIIPFDGEFSEKLVHFTRLRKLGIQISKGDYSFFTITNDTFKGLRNITLDTLIIKSAEIENVQSHAFYYLSELKSLDMCGTSGITTANFSPALIGLQNTKIEKLRLSFMRGNDMLLSPVSLEDFFCENLALPHLVDLHMDHTQLIAVHPNCFIELLNLKVLNLSFNLLTMKYLYYIIIPSLLPHKHLTELYMYKL